MKGGNENTERKCEGGRRRIRKRRYRKNKKQNADMKMGEVEKKERERYNKRTKE